MSSSKDKKGSKPNKHSSSTSQLNAGNSVKKQFPSISLTKHLQDYKAYRSIQNKKKFPDIDKTNTLNFSLQQRSMLMNRNLQMPSIHKANEMSIQGQFQYIETKIEKLQIKILKSLLTTKREQQWRLYMTKSELVQKSQQHEQLEEYLLKFISKCIDKTIMLNNTNNQEISPQDKVNEQLIKQQLKTPDNRRVNEMNKTFLNSSINENNKTAKKGTNQQPSLKTLKQQHNNNSFNTNYNNNDYNSLIMYNKTSVNLKNDPNNSMNKPDLIQKIQARYMEQINKMTFQRSLIQKKLELYQSRIAHLENKLKSENIPIDDLSSRDQFGSVIINEHSKPHVKKHNPSQDVLMANLINQNKYKAEAEVKKMQNQTLLKQINLIKQFSFKVKIDNQRLLKQLDDLQKQCIECREYKKYKQLWLMQCEEAIGWKNIAKERKDQMLKLNNKIKILKQKNKQLLHSFNFSMVVHPDQEEDKQELQNIIKGFQQWLKVMSIPRVNASTIDTKALLQDMTIKQKQYMPDPQNLNLKLLKPNFFIFFEAYQKTIMMQKNILNTRPLQPSFYVKIRAIFDSMYNHFNSYNHYKYWTSFPQFVIGFLQKYQICYTTMKMQTRKKPMASQEKLTFLMNLFNKKLSNTWQCDMFRSFILEEYTLDEIYFFLDCRNDLNGGAALTHGFGTIDPVNYVKLGKALATTQRKLFPYENYVIQRVRMIIKSRKIQKYGQMFIDRHFVLKLLLEVYALEKTKSQKIFEASFKTKNNKKTTVSYADYFSFMTKNFQFLTTVDVCELYRQTYALTSGKINHKAVHYVCQYKGLFIPLIWSKRLNMNVLEKSLNNDMIMLDLQNNARKIQCHLGQFGVQNVARLQNELNYFLRQMDWYRNNRQAFFFKLQELKIRIQKANCLIDWQSSTYTPNEMLSSQQIREGILQLHNLIHQSDNSVKVLANKRQEKEKAIRKITHNFKIRIQESVKEFKRVDEDQLRKLKQQMAIEIKLRQMKQRQEQAEKIEESDSNSLNNNNNDVKIEKRSSKKSIKNLLDDMNNDQIEELRDQQSQDVQ